ncbi:MAG: IPExxxVDY family protein [Flavobacterium sp.]|uniref:IPExxxVDY family protein n=1 Tax=Flavobacterium sp. TaxID=239 RepID=UPI001218D1A6|nr:IPExxxVDY family protein [Flavobacterium sp.]RZJ68059.1 MAG: IPExxxVDY family protein [Flavobacterium sp.]
MATHKLYIDEFDEIDYQLIAIHTSLEDYRLAFFINQKFPVLLSKNNDEIQITAKTGSTMLSRYSFDDSESCSSWDLLQNKSEIHSQSTSTTGDLFSGTNLKVSTKAWLLPEFKKVDYFLKLQNSEVSAESVTESLQEIEHITLSYPVDTSRIKSINNLIF